MRRKHLIALGLAAAAAIATAGILGTGAGAATHSQKLTKGTLQLNWVTQAQRGRVTNGPTRAHDPATGAGRR